MELNIPLSGGLSLRISDRHQDGKTYPTGHLQKGLLLLDSGKSLAEEGVGFGVPVLMRGLETIFPGSVALKCLQREPAWEISAVYRLNLVERIARDGETMENRQLYGMKNFLAAAIRHVPALRGLLSAASSMLRQVFHWETIYAEAGYTIEIQMRYQVQGESGNLLIEMETGNLPADITEVVVMNEQGAGAFDRFDEAGGVTLNGEEIGCWDEVKGSESRFESSTRQVAFQTGQVEGARLSRGRERIGRRLSWAGYGYSLPPGMRTFRYTMRIERLA